MAQGKDRLFNFKKAPNKYFVAQPPSQVVHIDFDSDTIIPIADNRIPRENAAPIMMVRFYHVPVPSNNYMREKTFKGWEIQAAIPNMDGKCFGRFTYPFFTPAYGLVRGCVCGERDAMTTLDANLPRFLRALKNQFAISHWIWESELHSEYEYDLDTGDYNPGSIHNGMLGVVTFSNSGHVVFTKTEPKEI